MRWLYVLQSDLLLPGFVPLVLNLGPRSHGIGSQRILRSLCCEARKRRQRAVGVSGVCVRRCVAMKFR